MSSEKITC